MDIFNRNNNIHLTSLNNYELYSLLSSINNYKLVLRDKLQIKGDFTFAPEIEFICRTQERAERIFSNEIKDKWNIKEELSIGNGFEITPKLFLKNNKEDYQNIKEVLNTIKKDPLSYMDYRCGLHINIGNQIFDNQDHVNNFISLWLAYEEVIFRFCYGDYLNPRQPILTSAMPLRNIKNNNLQYIYSLIKETKKNSLSLYKSTSFNYKYNNVLEIRCPNATYNPIILQNDLYLFLKMIEYSKNIDKNCMYNKIEAKKNIDFFSYNKIFLNEALDFSDKIFDNTIDKTYFLKQYLKRNKEITYNHDLVKMVRYKRL